MSGGRIRAWLFGWAGALAVIVAVCGVADRSQKTLPLGAFDQPFYLGIAHDLMLTGRFTNGFMFDVHGPASGRQSGMRFSPVYPVILAAAAMVDPVLRHGLACVVATQDAPDACSAAAPTMRLLQFAMLAGFFLLVWWIGGEVSVSAAVAWIGLGLALLTAGALLRSANLLMTEMTTLLFATGAMAAWLRARRPDRPMAWAGCAGGLLAATALTRPGFLYMLPFCVIGAGLLAAVRWRDGAAWRRALALALAGAGTLTPWYLRNWLMFERPALTYGYDSHTLVQRIAFDTMTWHEYGLAYLCWLPDGTSLGRRMVGPHACDRFGWDDQPNSFYSLGLRHMLDETLRAAGGYEHHLAYLLKHYVLVMPAWHMAVTVPLALRGAYVSHWWGFVLLPVCLWQAAAAIRRGDDGFLAVALPALFMLVFNAAVAVNQPRYNLLLVPAFAVAGALGLCGMAGRWQGGRWARMGRREVDG